MDPWSSEGSISPLDHLVIALNESTTQRLDLQDWKIRLEARKYRIWTLINIGLLLPFLLPLDEVEDGTV